MTSKTLLEVIRNTSNPTCNSALLQLVDQFFRASKKACNELAIRDNTG